jgi:CHAT domain-containing protein/tetratricopeptide (TPR) repeat protein
MQTCALLRLFPITLAAVILFGLSPASSVCCQTEINKPSEDEQYRNVVRAIARKNYLEALEQGRKLIERTNKYEQVYSRIVQAAKAAGQLEKAKTVFESLLRALPPNPRGYYGLGLICVEQKDYSAAIDNFKKCFNEQPEFPLALLALVDAYREDKKLIEAADFLESLVNTRPHNSVVHLALGYYYAKSEQIDAAVKEIDMALSLDPKMTEACYRKAQALTLFGRVKDSLEAIEKCLPPNKDETNEDRLQAFLNLLTANQVHLGNYAEAFSLSSRALELARALEDEEYEVASLVYLALIHNRQGNYPQALSCYQQAFAIAKESDKHSRYTNLRRYPSWIGDIYYALGDLRSAFQHFQLGLEMARKADDVNLQVFCLSRIGEVFIAWNDYNQAITYYKQLAEIEGGDANALNRLLFNDLLSTAYLRTGEYQKAEDSIQQMLKLARELPDFERQSKALNDLGELRLRLNEPEQAINAYHEALSLALDKNIPRHAWSAYAGLAMAYKRLEQLDKAREYYQRAIEIMEKVRANLGGEEERAGFFQDKVKVYKDLVAALMQLHDKNATKHYDAEAFHFTERGRARAFLDLLGEAKNIDQAIDPDLLKLQQENQTNISKLNIQLINERSKEPAKQDKEKIKGLEEELSKADEEQSNWLRELRSRHPSYADFKYPEPLKLEKAQRMLADHSLVLAYSLGEQESFLFAVSRDGYRVAKLPRSSDVGESVEKLIAAITDRAGASLEQYRAQAIKLYKDLIQPAGELLAGKRELIIIADDALHRLPFETLISPSIAGEPASVRSDYSKWPYLVRQFAVTYAPSVSALASLRDYHKETGAPQKAFVAYSDPNYDQQNAPAVVVALRSAGDGQQLKLGRLLNSRREVEGIAKLFAKNEADLYLEDSASEENVKAKDRLSRYRIVHFSAHGLVNEMRPRFSSIVLSLPKVDKEGNALSQEDGLLSAYEILNLKLNADLVVLSACQTGMGKEIKGEGMMGLMRAFMYAGTPSVMVSLWNVNDRSAADLMIRFYKHLWKPRSEKLNKAEALRKAQLEVIALGNKPYHWAPFILVGKP